MKPFLLLLGLLLTHVALSQATESILPIHKQKEPEFIGGISKLYAFIAKNFKEPPQYIRANVSGKIYARFRVTLTGQLDTVAIVKGPGFGSSEEMIRVIKLTSGKWKPGRINGKPTAMFYNLPIWLCGE